MVHDEDAARTVPVRGAQSVHVNPIGTTVGSVRAAVARAFVQLVGFDHLDDLGLSERNTTRYSSSKRASSRHNDQLKPSSMGRFA
jgi:hypothetical protein